MVRGCSGGAHEVVRGCSGGAHEVVRGCSGGAHEVVRWSGGGQVHCAIYFVLPHFLYYSLPSSPIPVCPSLSLICLFLFPRPLYILYSQVSAYAQIEGRIRFIWVWGLCFTWVPPLPDPCISVTIAGDKDEAKAYCNPVPLNKAGECVCVCVCVSMCV